MNQNRGYTKSETEFLGIQYVTKTGEVIFVESKEYTMKKIKEKMELNMFMYGKW